MSETPDPFAARPYTPPSERNAEPAAESAPESASESTSGSTPESTPVEAAVDALAEATPEVEAEPATNVPVDAAAEEAAETAPEPPAFDGPTTHRFEPAEQPADDPDPVLSGEAEEAPAVPSAASLVEPVSAPASPEPVAAAPEPALDPVLTASSYASAAEPDTHPASVIPSSIVFPYESESARSASGHAHSSHGGSHTSGHSGGWPDTARTDTPKSGGAGRKVAGALAIAVLGAAAGVGGGAAYEEYLAPDRASVSTVDLPADTTKAPTGQVEKVAASVLPSVVQIMVSGGDAAGSGTGIIISNDGEILTNNHVVEVAAGNDGKIIVVFSDGTNTPAKIVGQDPVTDIAVIKANVKGLTPAKLGSTRSLQVGQTVVAVGSPFGLSSSVTAGIISALNRPVTEPADEDNKSSGTTFPGIQTDAAINPGNSGGPLVDLSGRVIGINSVIQSSGGGLFGGEAGSIGLGFAIPIDLAKSVASQLLAGKKVEHAQIGVTVSAAVADNKLTTIGAKVRDVKAGSAGAKAGLKAGDIITAVNNIPVARSEGLIAAIRAYQPGDKVTLTFLRDDKKQTTEVTLGSDGGKLSQ